MQVDPITSPRGHRVAVAALVVLSLACVLGWSRELRFELTGTSYKRELVRQFFVDLGVGGITLFRPVAPAGAVALVLWLLSCMVAGTAVRRAVRGAGDVPQLIAFVLAATTVPTLLLATLRWPDGRGTIGASSVIGTTLALAIVAWLVALRRERTHPSAAGPASNPAEAGDRRGPPSAAPEVGIQAPSQDPGRGWALAVVVALVPLVLAAWWNGVDAIRGFDSLSDHLPRAARSFRLSSLAVESGELLTPHFPGGFHILVAWMLVLRTDAYAFVPSYAAAVAALACIYHISRELGQPRWTALMSAALAATCSLVPYLATTVEADLPATAFLLFGVLLLLRWQRLPRAEASGSRVDGDVAPLAAVGTALGLAVGTKYAVIPSALLLALVTTVMVLRRSDERMAGGRPRLNLRAFLLRLACLLGPVMLCGSFWYLRNLVEHGNPTFPVAIAGLPGVDMRFIVPVKPSLVGSMLHRASYAWVHWDFQRVYDDGLGIAFAAVALPAFAIMVFPRPPVGSRRRFVWGITFGAYVAWLGTGSITARFGLFPIMLTFVFAGELWREFESVTLKLATVVAAMLGSCLLTSLLVVGAVYTTRMPPGRRSVPAVVDRLPPTRIFNATAAANRYPLLGSDYRHEVITMFTTPRPSDLDASGATYFLLDSAQVTTFDATRRGTLAGVGLTYHGHVPLSLWRARQADSALGSPLPSPDPVP